MATATAATTRARSPFFLTILRCGLYPMPSVSSAGMETIEVTRHGGIVTVMLNRPAKKNAATGQLWGELLEALREISRSADDRVVIVTGAGGEFCAGADLWEAPGSGA